YHLGVVSCTVPFQMAYSLPFFLFFFLSFFLFDRHRCLIYTLMPFFLGCIAFFTLAGGLPMETSLLATIGCIYILMFMNVHCPSSSNKAGVFNQGSVAPWWSAT